MYTGREYLCNCYRVSYKVESGGLWDQSPSDVDTAPSLERDARKGIQNPIIGLMLQRKAIFNL